MAIVGGAVLTLVMGLISDAAHSVAWAYVVPLVSYIFIAFYSFLGSKQVIATGSITKNQAEA
jgi:FHS family L-fucose permease-like MFS transporter